MVLRLDPRLAILWRTPHSLQFGLDEPVVVLHDVSDGEAQLIGSLVTGLTRPGADLLGSRAGVHPQAVSRLLDDLSPALVERRVEPARPSRVLVEGVGPTAIRIATILGESEVELLAPRPDKPRPDKPRPDEPDLDEPELVIMVARYVIDPDAHGSWLRRDVPHLPVVFGDTSVRVGPVVRPGVGPCLYCLECHRTDEDPSWPALAAQAWGHPGVDESSLVAGEVAALAVRMALRGSELRHTSATLDVATGVTRVDAWEPHPRCGCIAPSGL